MYRLLIVSSLLISTGAAVSFWRFQPVIIGGIATSIDRFPHQVSVQLKGKHVCGGAIVSAKFVLTTAYCTNDRNVNDLSIRAGSSFYDNGGDVVNVEQIIQHEEFDLDKMHNDIALIKLKAPLVFKETIKPIQLPEDGKIIPANVTATITGWGAQSASGDLSYQLRVVDVSTIDNNDCAIVFKNVEDGQLCTGMSIEGRGACNGDVGGPLLIQNTLEGLYSWSLGCAEKNIPQVFTRISQYLQWIKENSDLTYDF